jgi:hypothetical protein
MPQPTIIKVFSCQLVITLTPQQQICEAKNESSLHSHMKPMDMIMIVSQHYQKLIQEI